MKQGAMEPLFSHILRSLFICWYKHSFLYILAIVNFNQQRGVYFLVSCDLSCSLARGIYKMIVLSLFQVKKHIKQGEGHTGGIFSIEAPLHVSNVQIVDPVTAYVYDTLPWLSTICFIHLCINNDLSTHCIPRKPCKVGYKYLEDGTKVRFARGMNASGAVIPRPEILKERRKPRPTSRMSH
jgi:hypothetical protein